MDSSIQLKGGVKMVEELELNENDFEVEEISEEEFKEGGSRSSSSWKHEALKQWATKAVEQCSGKSFKYSIDKFYKQFREDAGSDIVKYASYYSRKALIEAFETIGAKAKVKTVNTKNSSTQGDLKISIIGY